MEIEEAIKILTNADYLMNIQAKTCIGNRVAIETLVNAYKEQQKEIEKHKHTKVLVKLNENGEISDIITPSNEDNKLKRGGINERNTSSNSINYKCNE